MREPTVGRGLPPAVAEEYRRAGWWRPSTLPQRAGVIREAYPDRVAFVDGSFRLTFAEFGALVDRLAGHLHRLGVRPGDVVSWQLPNWWEAAVVHHAILAAGAVPNPLNPIFRARELSFVLSEARPRVLIVPQRFRDVEYADLAERVSASVDSIEHVVVVRGAGALSLTRLLDEPAGRPDTPSDPSALALLLYTSGTTSDPKGVLHSHETLVYEIESLREIHAITLEDRYLGGAPVAHIAGLVYGVLMPCTLGTSTVFLARWDAARHPVRRRGTAGTSACPSGTSRVPAR